MRGHVGETFAVYGSPNPTGLVEINDVYVSLPEVESDSIDDLLQRLHDRQLIRIPFSREHLRLTAEGKLAYEDGCIPELVLGEQYIDYKYRQAVVHIIVRNDQGVEGAGTGFFVLEPQNNIITAKHLFERGRRLVRVEDINGNVICRDTSVIRLAPGQLDLAIVECEMPAALSPFRVQWQEDTTRELDRVLIFGYPPFPGHAVALLRARGEINAKVSQLDEDGRYSLMISNVTAPGCSGGPVTNEAGLVVGVVARENILQREGEPQAVRFVSATPAPYLREV